MIDRTISKRYARALLDLAVQHHAVSQFEAEILNVAELFRAVPEFRRTITHPVLSRSKKKEFIRTTFANRLSQHLIEFLCFLVEKNRGEYVPDIAAVFDALADEYEGVVRVDVRSARPLSDAQRASLLTRVTRLVGGRKVELRPALDPALLGGSVVQIGDTVLDGSLAHRLKTLRESLIRTAARG